MDGRNKRITLAQIALEAGVSRTTVSMALRNHPRVSADTCRRIQELAALRNFRPDPVLSAVAMKRAGHGRNPHGNTAFLSFRNPFSPTSSPPSGIFRLEYLGAREAAEKRGCHMDHFFIDDPNSCVSVERMLWHRGVSGVIFCQIFDREVISGVNWSRFSVVGADVGHITPPCHQVRFDWIRSVAMAWERAWLMGYRRIGLALLDEPGAVDIVDKFGSGSFDALRLAKPADRVPPGLFGLDDRECFFRWYREHRPDVVMGFTSTVRDWMTGGGLSVPRDSAFISLYLNGDYEGEDTAGIQGPNRDLGGRAFQLLETLMRSNERGFVEAPMIYMIPMIWRDGTSCPKKGSG